MNVSEAIGVLRAALEDVDPHLSLLDNAADVEQTHIANVKSLEDQKAKGLADIRALKAEQDRVSATHQQQLAQNEAELLNQLKGHQDQISAVQHTHDELVALVNDLQSRHDNLLASIESLKKRFG